MAFGVAAEAGAALGVALDGRVVGSWDVRTGALDAFEPLDAEVQDRAERAAADAAAWF